jgi:hypothetical protein
MSETLEPSDVQVTKAELEVQVRQDVGAGCGDSEENVSIVPSHVARGI